MYNKKALKKSVLLFFICDVHDHGLCDDDRALHKYTLSEHGQGHNILHSLHNTFLHGPAAFFFHKARSLHTMTALAERCLPQQF